MQKLPVRLLLFLTSAAFLIPSARAQSWIPEYNRLLQSYRNGSGIDYHSWHQNSTDMERLERIVKSLAEDTPPDTNDANEIAYYTNAYNILVIHGVLKAYPVESVTEIAFNFGFFSQKRFILGGQKVSLNEIEKVRLLQQFNDPRIHFIVNCASVSCPPLPAVALTAENLEEVMNRATRAFLNDHPEGIQRKGQTYRISKLFDWYHKDFTNSGRSIIGYINRFRENPIPENAQINYLNYDWNLNQSEDESR